MSSFYSSNKYENESENEYAGVLATGRVISAGIARSLRSTFQNDQSLVSTDLATTAISSVSSAVPSVNRVDSTIKSPRVQEFDEEEVMYVVTRTGRKELLDPNQITTRLQTLINKKPKIHHVNPYELMLEVNKGLKSGITTFEIDEYAANASASLSTTNPYYLKIAARIAIDNHQKNTLRSFVDKMSKLYLLKDDNGVTTPLLDAKFFKYVEENQDAIEQIIDYSRDFLLDFFGFRTFQKSYSLSINGKPIERPQDMFMRTAVALHMGTRSNIEEELIDIRNTYDLLSQKLYTHASPTYFNAGSTHPQFASCFLLGSHDSREGIMKTADDMSQISKWAGGLGVHVNTWRGAGAKIRGTNGNSAGMTPFLRIYSDVMRAFNQGGRRPGSAAIYLMPHHPDFMNFVELRRNTGNDEDRIRDLFYAVWIPDLFMEKVEKNEMWSFFDPDKCGDLSLLWGNAYKKRYIELEKAGKYFAQRPAREIWLLLQTVNDEVGQPFICYSDNANKCNMQSNIGVLVSSNLCVSGDTLILTEIGYRPIELLTNSNQGKHIIWNGFEWSEAQFAKTGSNKQLLEVSFSNGTTLKCTPEHRFMLHDNTEKTAQQLAIGDKLLSHTFPIIRRDSDSKIITLQMMFEHASEILSDWSIRITDHDKSNLLGLKRMSNELGCSPDVTPHVRIYKLTFKMHDIHLLIKQGMKFTKHGYPQPANTADTLYKIKENVRTNVHITLIELLSTSEDTYCFNEPLRHMGTFNGVLAMNCTEIYITSNNNEYGVCILCSIALPNFVLDGYSKEELLQPESERRALNHEFPKNPYFDFAKFINTAKTTTTNLNLIVDKTYHPVEEAKRGSDRHRPVATGVQGLDDCYAKMRYPFDSSEARKLNKEIFEALYFATLSQSSKLARQGYLDIKKKCTNDGKVTITQHHVNSYTPTEVTYTDPEAISKKIAAYPSIDWNGGSPISRGIFHWELFSIDKNILQELQEKGGWDAVATYIKENKIGQDKLSGMFDWESLREHILHFGVKNSLLVALMPTASTSQLLGNNEAIEPYTSNIYSRKTLAGDYVVVKKHLVNDLYNLGIWSQNVKEYLLMSKGSIQHIEGIPDQLKKLYPTVWEIDQEVLVDQAIDRQPFVDQGESLNLYYRDTTMRKKNAIQFKAWKSGLKTGKYYQHSEPSMTPQAFTIDPIKQKEMLVLLEKNKTGTAFLEPLREVCEVCSS